MPLQAQALNPDFWYIPESSDIEMEAEQPAAAQDSKADSKAAIDTIDETIEILVKKEEHWKRKIAAELANAMKFNAAGKTREALQCLNKKKMYAQQLTTLETSKSKLEDQKLTMESMIMKAALAQQQEAHARQLKELEDLQAQSDALRGQITSAMHSRRPNLGSNEQEELKQKELEEELRALVRAEEGRAAAAYNKKQWEVGVGDVIGLGIYRKYRKRNTKKRNTKKRNTKKRNTKKRNRKIKQY